MKQSTQTIIIVLGIAFACACVGALALLGMYNQPMTLKLAVEQQLGIVAVMQQRQADVVIQAQAGFGQIVGLDNAQILGFVREAEALNNTLNPFCNKTTGICNFPDDPEQLKMITDAMSQFDTKSASFIAYVQQHPQLRAADAFDTFMIAVEGSANRVSTERRTLQFAITAFKGHCINPPGSIFCGMRGLTGNEFQYFEAAPNTEIMPTPAFPTIVVP